MADTNETPNNAPEPLDTLQDQVNVDAPSENHVKGIATDQTSESHEGGASQAAESSDEATAAPTTEVTQTPTATALPTSGLAIAGLVLGILSVIVSFVPLIRFGAIVLAIIGAVLALVGFANTRSGKADGKGIAIAGIVLNTIAIVMALATFTTCAAILGGASGTTGGTAATSVAPTNMATGVPSDVQQVIKNVEAKPKRNFSMANGWDIKFAGTTFEVPDFFEKDDGSTSLTFSTTDGESTVTLIVTDNDTSLTDFEFKRQSTGTMRSLMEKLEATIVKTSGNITIAGHPGYVAVGYIPSRDVVIGAAMFVDDKNDQLCMIACMQPSGTKYNYLDTFYKTVASGKKL